jgi:hypothetical protein
MPDALFLVCDNLYTPLGQNDYIDTDASNKIVRTTPLVLGLPEDSRRTVFGHEITHAVHKDGIASNPTDEETSYQEFASSASALVRSCDNNRACVSKLDQIATELKERADAARVVADYRMEMRADWGGLILATGKSCKIDPVPLEKGLKTLLKAIPVGLSEDRSAHPDVDTRITYLQENMPAIKTECENHYRAQHQQQSRQFWQHLLSHKK